MRNGTDIKKDVSAVLAALLDAGYSAGEAERLFWRCYQYGRQSAGASELRHLIAELTPYPLFKYERTNDGGVLVDGVFMLHDFGSDEAFPVEVREARKWGFYGIGGEWVYGFESMDDAWKACTDQILGRKS